MWVAYLCILQLIKVRMSVTVIYIKADYVINKI